jgi:hypothetical protein
MQAIESEAKASIVFAGIIFIFVRILGQVTVRAAGHGGNVALICMLTILDIFKRWISIFPRYPTGREKVGDGTQVNV